MIPSVVFLIMMLLVYKESVALLKLALPVLLAQLAMVGMSATDVFFAGKVGNDDLAGVSLGANAWNTVIFFFLGIAFATQPLIAKLHGAHHQAGIKHQLHQSLWLCLALGVMATVAIVLLSLALSFMPVSQSFKSIAVDYLAIMSLSAIPLLLTTALRGTVEGLGLTKIVLWVNALMFLLNIPLDYVLLNGLYGFPVMGGVGCAWATVALTWFAMFGMLVCFYCYPILKHNRYFSAFQAPCKQTIFATFRLGFPIGISIIIELTLFSGTGMLSSLFGSIQASSHSVTITIASMSYVCFMGLSQGVTIRASHFLGANRPRKAWYCIKVGLSLNMMFAFFTAMLFFWIPETLVTYFSSDTEVIKLAGRLMLFAAAFQLGDALQTSIVCALRAYQDTKTPPIYQFIAFWVLGWPLAIYLAFYSPWQSLSGTQGLWFAMVVSLSVVSSFFLFKLLQLKKQQINMKYGNQI